MLNNIFWFTGLLVYIYLALIALVCLGIVFIALLNTISITLFRVVSCKKTGVTINWERLPRYLFAEFKNFLADGFGVYTTDRSFINGEYNGLFKWTIYNYDYVQSVLEKRKQDESES